MKFAFILIAGALSLHAQNPDPHAGHQMPGMHHDHAGMSMDGMNAAGMLLMRQASGTSVNPEAWPMPMLMKSAGPWHLMFMGQAFLVETQQSGPRGGDKLFSPNWGMISAERSLGRGSIMFQFMPSLDPVTITSRRYPLLFQTGETAYGRPIVDGQHPHDLIMSLGVHYARPLGEHTTFQAYFAPVGDPALGPVAFPHRASAMELPQASLGHHWQDSSHIANEVVTVGLTHRILKLEASGFHGAEPGENRWNIDHGAIDSWSGRLWVFPTRNWAAQVSVGRLAHPEALEPGDVVRATASLQYSRPMAGSAWSTSLIWGRNHKTAEGSNTNSYLLESVLPVSRRNWITGRAELVDKDELFAAHDGHNHAYRVGAYTLGYTRDFDMAPHLKTGVGVNFTAYTTPSALKAAYGDHPWGVNVYLRVRLQ